VTFALAGPAWNPRIEGLSLDAAARSIGQQAAAGAIGRALGIPGGSTDQQKAQAEEKAKKEADAQRQKLEQEAQKRLKGLLGQ
jgi:AsmA protein